MTDPQLGAAYHQAFADTEADAVQRMRDFIATLPDRQASVHRGRWVLPIGVAAAVAAVAVTTMAVTAGGFNPAEPAGIAPAEAPPAVASTSSLHSTSARTTGPSSTASANPLTTRSPRPTAPTGPASAHSAAPTLSPLSVVSATSPPSRVWTPSPTPPASTVSSDRSYPATPEKSAVSTMPGTRGAPAVTPYPTMTTYPTLGAPGITGPLAPFAKASAYTKIPAGLVIRTPADNVSSQNNVATGFTMYISAANHDPKVVVGGYLVTVAAPSVHYQSIDGQGPSTVPAGAALHRGDRTWHWNADHTLLISTSADADIYIGVLATRAMNEFEPTIPTGYSTADIELIAVGLRG